MISLHLQKKIFLTNNFLITIDITMVMTVSVSSVLL